MSIAVCRTVDEKRFPPINSTTLIVDKNCNVMMKSGGQMSKSDARTILTDYIPKALAGDCKIILVWHGQWRDDAFELVNKEDLDMYEQKLADYIYS